MIVGTGGIYLVNPENGEIIEKKLFSII